MPSLYAAIAVAEYNPPPNLGSPPEDESTMPSSGPHRLPEEIAPTSGSEAVNGENNRMPDTPENSLGSEVSNPERPDVIYDPDILRQ